MGGISSLHLNMALNKLALIRYKTIDACLSNRFRKWTLEDLIEKVSDTLYEYEGISEGVSKRTIQLDIQTMRSERLYNAPIVVVDKKFYTYEDPKFRITESPLGAADLEKMNEVVGILRQLSGFSHFGEMREIIARLENDLNRNRTAGQSVVHMESNPMLKGLEWIDPLFKAILAKRTLRIDYQSFKSRQVREGIYYPYLLKEYRNRWFLMCKAKGHKTLLNLALDRIQGLETLRLEPFVEHPSVDFDHYFEDVIGVTKSENAKTVPVLLEFDAETVPYVLTKPLHASQQIMHTENGKTIVKIEVVPNFELEREILGFGAHIKVLGPRFLKSRIAESVKGMLALYGAEPK